jgi:hypothetical protein
MKKLSFVFSILVILGILFFAGTLFAADGVLVDKNGNSLEGFSNVYFDENGNPYPVYNEETGLWYSVVIIGINEDGTIRCRLGLPTGTGGSDFNGPGDKEEKLNGHNHHNGPVT